MPRIVLSHLFFLFFLFSFFCFSFPSIFLFKGNNFSSSSILCLTVLSMSVMLSQPSLESVSMCFAASVYSTLLTAVTVLFDNFFLYCFLQYLMDPFSPLSFFFPFFFFFKKFISTLDFIQKLQGVPMVIFIKTKTCIRHFN